MSNRSNTSLALAAAVAAATLMTSGAQAQTSADKERCYGISMAGKNDCAATGNNTCAGTAKMDFDAKAWKYVAKGTCTSMEVTLRDGKKRKGTLQPM